MRQPFDPVADELPSDTISDADIMAVLSLVDYTLKVCIAEPLIAARASLLHAKHTKESRRGFR